ncbi:F178B protein, partial [Thinocorus orbignyianus]|nr:F178B protein [Thinocorus orbignyianus]
GAGAAMAAQPEGRRWYQIPLSSARVPRSVIFSYGFQAGLRRYQQLRALKHLRVGRPVAPPPPGLLEPCPPVAPSAADGPPQTPQRPRASQGSPPCQVTSETSSRVPVLPAADTASHGGDANRRQHTAAGTVPRQEGRSSEGHPLGTAREWVPSTDSEDDELIPLRDMLLAGDEPPSPADHQQVACPQLNPLANSLESLVQEKREQSQAATLQPDPAGVHTDDDSAWESLEEDTELSEDDRAFLARYTMTPRLIPTIHPGEPVFCTCPGVVPTLDTHGLKPQSTLEGFFLCNSPACQAAFVHDGGLSLLYRCLPTCPLPVLRWLFQVSPCHQRVSPPPAVPPASPPPLFWQLMTLCPDTTNASQALWEIWLSTGGEPWCPTLQEISEAFAHLGADLRPLCHQHLLPPELCPPDRSLDPSFSLTGTLSAITTLALVTRLSDICKFLALCVVTQPCRYPDGARLALVTLLCFLSLDQALRCQPLPELQHLLHCLLEGMQDWQGQGASPVSEPSRHSPAAGEATGHRATSRGTGRGGWHPGGTETIPWHSPRVLGP